MLLIFRRHGLNCMQKSWCVDSQPQFLRLGACRRQGPYGGIKLGQGFYAGLFNNIISTPMGKERQMILGWVAEWRQLPLPRRESPGWRAPQAQEPGLQTPWSRTFGLLKFETIDFCCLKKLFYIVWWHLKKVNIWRKTVKTTTSFHVSYKMSLSYIRLKWSQGETLKAWDTDTVNWRVKGCREGRNWWGMSS